MRQHYGTLAVALLFVANASGRVIRVDADATGTPDGDTWCTAFTNLRQVLQNTAQDGDEVRVAEGTYRAALCLPPPIPCNFRGNSFVLRNGIAVLGGYAGCGEPVPDERNIVTHLTILSGDLLDDDGNCMAPGVQCLANDPERAENTYHVVSTQFTQDTDTAVLDGFTIYGGNANGATPESDGGGILATQGELTVRNCRLFQNFAVNGGGMLNNGTDPIISNCVFEENIAEDRGGGMDNAFSAPLLTDCRFEKNRSGQNGGGLNIKGASGVFSMTRCDFIDNHADTSSSVLGGGGAFFGTDATFSVEITHCVFENNRATSGAGVYLAQNRATLTDCFFTGNVTTNVEPGKGRGGGAFLGGTTPQVTMRDCDFLQNTAKDGGGVYIDQPHVTFTLCSFVENTALPASPATGSGGGVWANVFGNLISTANELRFYNTLFLRNEANDDGGGVYIKGSAVVAGPYGPEPDPDFGFCTFVGNVAGGLGGGIYHEDVGTGPFSEEINPQVTSCILWDNIDSGGNNESAQIHNGGAAGEAVFRYNCIKEFSQTGPGDTHNISADPRFLDRLGLDADTVNDFFLGDGSPCIDAADWGGHGPSTPDSDLVGNPRAVDDEGAQNTGIPYCPQTCEYADMGVYESPGWPYIIHDQPGTPFARAGFSDYIDPRKESSDGVSIDLGIDSVVMVFSEEVVDSPGGIALTSAAFSVNPPGGVSISCVGDVLVDSRHLVLIQLSDHLPLQQWTTIIADVEDLAGNRIRTPIAEFCTCTASGCPGPDRPDRIVLGYLPADADQNGTVGPADLLIFRQYVNGVATPPRGVAADYTDTDRDGVSPAPFDLLVFRQLVNGIPPATRDWLGQSLPPRPCFLP